MCPFLPVTFAVTGRSRRGPRVSCLSAERETIFSLWDLLPSHMLTGAPRRCYSEPSVPISQVHSRQNTQTSVLGRHEEALGFPDLCEHTQSPPGHCPRSKCKEGAGASP